MKKNTKKKQTKKSKATFHLTFFCKSGQFNLFDNSISAFTEPTLFGGFTFFNKYFDLAVYMWNITKT